MHILYNIKVGQYLSTPNRGNAALLTVLQLPDGLLPLLHLFNALDLLMDLSFKWKWDSLFITLLTGLCCARLPPLKLYKCDL